MINVSGYRVTGVSVGDSRAVYRKLKHIRFAVERRIRKELVDLYTQYLLSPTMRYHILGESESSNHADVECAKWLAPKFRAAVTHRGDSPYDLTVRLMAWKYADGLFLLPDVGWGMSDKLRHLDRDVDYLVDYSLNEALPDTMSDLPHHGFTRRRNVWGSIFSKETAPPIVLDIMNPDNFAKFQP